MVARSTVSEELDEEALERPLPDWAEVHQELRHKGVTLFLLWGEYKSRCPEGGSV